MTTLQDRYGRLYEMPAEHRFPGELFVECDSGGYALFVDVEQRRLAYTADPAELFTIMHDLSLDHLPVTFTAYDEATADDQVFCPYCGTAPCSD